MRMTHVQLLRYAQGLTAQDVARRMGSTQPSVSRFETGNRKVTGAWIGRYAFALGVGTDEVLRALQRGKCRKLKRDLDRVAS